jgi:hypothetical protein
MGSPSQKIQRLRAHPRAPSVLEFHREHGQNADREEGAGDGGSEVGQPLAAEVTGVAVRNRRDCTQQVVQEQNPGLPLPGAAKPRLMTLQRYAFLAALLWGTWTVLRAAPTGNLSSASAQVKADEDAIREVAFRGNA